MAEENTRRQVNSQPGADWRWQEQQKQLAQGQPGGQKPQVENFAFPSQEKSETTPKETTSQTPEEATSELTEAQIPPEHPYLEQNLVRLEEPEEQVAVSGEEGSVLEVKPMGTGAFVILMSLATAADLVDVLDVVIDAATFAAWTVISLILDILINGAFFVWSWILCDKYTRQVLLQSNHMTSADLKDKVLALAKNLKYLSAGIKVANLTLQVGDSVPVIELIPFTVITVLIMFAFSHYVAGKVRELQEAETEEEAQAALVKIQQAEQALQVATSALEQTRAATSRGEAKNLGERDVQMLKRAD